MKVQVRKFTTAPNQTQPWTCRIIGVAGRVVQDFSPPPGCGGFRTEAEARAYGERAMRNIDDTKWR